MPQEIRLYVADPLVANGEITLSQAQSHYLANVMRAKEGDAISVFNGVDGQWQAEIVALDKKRVTLAPRAQTRPQVSSPDLWLVFAPIKNKTELVVEKAVELGASKLIPIVTRHAVVRSVNMGKLEAHAIEAAEQCERLDIPVLETYKDLSYLLGAWPKDRLLLYGDESGGGESLNVVLDAIEKGKIAILIGPEGGFAGDEFGMLRACEFTKSFGMGPRILRADTAAVAALACVQAKFGDWDQQPHFTPSPSRGEAGRGASHAHRYPIANVREFARSLRKEMTTAETLMWNLLRGKQLGAKFRKQHPIGPYVADFACLTPKLIIELDGGQHAQEAIAKKDAERTAFLESQGFTVLRFWNNDVFDNIESVAERIYTFLHSEQECPHPNPPPSGEGI